MTLDDFKQNRFYLIEDDNEICVFKIYDFNTDLGLLAEDVFVQSRDGIDDLTSGWTVAVIYSQEQIERMKEIDPDDYPEYFI